VQEDELAAFEAAFPYEETPDQAAAIEDVKKDLASSKPMDRLICGDAGYGKTEVAMRAAFIAAMNGKQTALLAPTTVLAQQHYETFLARFAETPVRIESLSRFQTEESKKGARARLASGAADIVIGTHALLSSKVQFKDIGLIIVDEEQRFGVKHKEYLKSIRATADVLTMSATPIPRTLYLSMTGARDLSVLKTPPRERVATETKIVRDGDSTIKAAVERELARGGQVYYLYNRVLTMEKAHRRIKELCPGASVDVAHGQMPSNVLEGKMRRFAQGLTDVLICTTIVESGLDITRANTIIVDRADRFGIAELYQLRGRVGRGSRQGYAYFLLPEEGLVDSDARERLDALRKHSGHGSGYNLSLRDLEIRGAGNLLGSEQSGHIAAVGFSLYCQLLQRTIAKMRGEAVHDIVDVSVNLDFVDFSPGSADEDAGASLPYDYVEEESGRMAFHHRLAQAATEKDVLRLRRELADRYGKLPPAAVRLVRLAEFRVRCAAKRISRIDVKGERAVFYMQGSRDVAFVERLEGKTADRKITSLFKMIENV
jgi:transcription-repair coupling factor (superfamily II helicase)